MLLSVVYIPAVKLDKLAYTTYTLQTNSKFPDAYDKLSTCTRNQQPNSTYPSLAG